MSFANESLLECIFRVLHSSLLALFLVSLLFVCSSSDVYRVIWRPAKNSLCAVDKRFRAFYHGMNLYFHFLASFIYHMKFSRGSFRNGHSDIHIQHMDRYHIYKLKTLLSRVSVFNIHTFTAAHYFL